MMHCLICDDHPLVAQALAATVAARWPGAQLALAADFAAAKAAAADNIDLCLVDLDMPGAAPLAGIAAIIAAAPTARIIVVSGSADDALLLDLLALGIAGFIPKTSPPAVIGAAIDLVMAGGRYLPPRMVAPELVRTGPARAILSATDSAPIHLSPRQVEVAGLLARGLSNKDIARRLGVAPATIKTHVAQLMTALGALNRTDAAMKAREIGIV
jgi:DNA-binding NarL/FixJ family response regulator